jgi:hypothetical protein
MPGRQEIKEDSLAHRNGHVTAERGRDNEGLRHKVADEDLAKPGSQVLGVSFATVAASWETSVTHTSSRAEGNR